MYSFIALPEKSILQKLNTIRKYLYTNGFRYSNTPPTSDVHVSLFHFEHYPDELVLDKLNNLKNLDEIIIDNYKLMNRPHNESTNKINEPSNWIALQFDSENLKLLAKEIMNIVGIRSTVAADHINLCNYAKPDRSQEAIEYINSLNLPEVITLSRIAIRNDHGDLLWSQELN